MAALAGFSLRLVHSRTEESAFRRVARLYSELSFRMDPGRLELVVLGGGKSPAGRLGQWLRDTKLTAFAGVRPTRPGTLAELARRLPNLVLPIVLMQDEAVGAVYRSLGLGPVPKESKASGLTPSSLEARSKYYEKRFGGVQADSNAVIDAIKRGS
jgi:hypothetical protein